MPQAHLGISGIWLEENPGDNKSPNNHLPYTEPSRREAHSSLQWFYVPLGDMMPTDRLLAEPLKGRPGSFLFLGSQHPVLSRSSYSVCVVLC